MANSAHVEIVRQGAEAIAGFRKENPNVKLDLNDVNLSGADLQICDLSFADLSSADLSEAHLIGAALNGAILRQVNLDGADLVLKQATSSRQFGVKNRAAANRNERVAGVTLS